MNERRHENRDRWGVALGFLVIVLSLLGIEAFFRDHGKLMSFSAIVRQLPSLPYAGVMRMRSFLFRAALLPSHRLSCPVLSVGNLTFGGTGKTPLVCWLVQQLTEMRRKVGILSRGYGGGTEGNDEAAMLADYLPGIPHVQNPNRVEGGKALLEKYGVEAIVLDDGFQHLRLKRDLDLCLLGKIVSVGQRATLKRLHHSGRHAATISFRGWASGQLVARFVCLFRVQMD